MLQFLGFKWHIIEANPRRLGGRLFTKYLNDELDYGNYYDIGAMRFPFTPVMERTFEVFHKTETKLGKYIMKADKQPMRYNDITKWNEEGKDLGFDPFQVS